MELIEYLQQNYDLLDDLCKRLQNEYNGDVEHFKQEEQDRLIICNILELIEKEQEQEERQTIRRNMEALESLTRKRYETIKELKYMINNRIVDMHVTDIEDKRYYDNGFQDYEIMATIGDNKKDYIDLTIYYAKTRSGYLITEIADEEDNNACIEDYIQEINELTEEKGA